MRKLFFVSTLALVTALSASAQKDPALQDPFLSSVNTIPFNRLKEDGLTYGGIISLDSGKILFEGPSWDASLVHDGFATIDASNPEKDRYFFVDETGKKAFGGREFDGAGTFSEGKVFVAKDGRISCMDTAGKTLFTLPRDASFALPFREGYAFYKAESGWWLVDETGRHVFQESFAEVQPFVANGRVIAADGKTGLWGVVTPSGKEILPFQYGYLGVVNVVPVVEWVRALGGPLLPFREGDAGTNWGLVDVATRKVVLKPVYYVMYPESGGFRLYQDESDSWFETKTRTMKEGPEEPVVPAALKNIFSPWWAEPITGSDLYLGRRQADMKFAIYRSDGTVVVPASGNVYPSLVNKEVLSTDYLAYTMGCAKDRDAERELLSLYDTADGDGLYEEPDLNYFTESHESEPYDFLEWCYSRAGEGEEFSSFTWDCQNMFLGTKPLKGILGDDRKEISVWFTTAEAKEDGFFVKGKSSVAGGAACTFTGELNYTMISPLTAETGQTFYLLFGTYCLEEDAGQKGTGVFEGTFLYYLERLKDGRLSPVKDRSIPKAYGFDMNKVFVGIWTSHRTGNNKRCHWSDGFVPYSHPY